VAASEGRFDDAHEELGRACDRGLPEEDYRELLAALQGSRPWTDVLTRLGEEIGVVGIGGMALLFVVGPGLSRLALRAAARPASSAGANAPRLEVTVRRAYAGGSSSGSPVGPPPRGVMARSPAAAGQCSRSLPRW
jgi:hypothetical protein